MKPHRPVEPVGTPDGGLETLAPQPPVALLQDKVVVLSGVGPGLGRALGEVCARHGADLVLAARTERRLEKAVAAVEELGRRAVAVPPHQAPRDDGRGCVRRPFAGASVVVPVSEKW